MHKRRSSATRRTTHKKAHKTAHTPKQSSLTTLKSHQRAVHSIPQAHTFTRNITVHRVRSQSNSTLSRRSFASHASVSTETPTANEKQSPSQRPLHPYVFFKATDILHKSEQRDKVFPFGLTIGVNRQSNHDLENVSLTPSAMRYLSNIELGSRHMFANFAPMGVRQVKGIRLALFGTQSQIEQTPWECYRGLITEVPRAKGSVLIRVPLSLAFTDADRPTPLSELHPSTRVLKPLVDIANLLLNDKPDPQLDLIKPHSYLTRILYQSMLSPSAVSRLSLPFGPTHYLANDENQVVTSINKSYDGHLYCSLGDPLRELSDHEESEVDTALSAPDPTVNPQHSAAMKAQKERQAKEVREAFQQDDILKKHVELYDKQVEFEQKQQEASTLYPMALDPLLLGLYHPQIPLNTLRDLLYEQIRRSSFPEPKPTSPATEQLLRSVLPVPVSLIDQVIIYSTRNTQSMMQLAVQAYYLNEFTPYNSRFLGTHGLPMTLSHLSTRTIEIPSPIANKYRDWKIFEENQIHAANVIQSAVDHFQHSLEQYDYEYKRAVARQKEMIKSKHAEGQEVTENDLNIVVPTPTLIQMKLPENDLDKLTTEQQSLRKTPPEVMLLPYVDFMNHALTKAHNNVDLHFEFEETKVLEEFLSKEDIKLVEKVILGLQMEIRQLEIYIQQNKDKSVDTTPLLSSDIVLNPRIAHHKINTLQNILSAIEQSFELLQTPNSLPVVSVVAKRDIVAGEELCLAYHRLNDGGKSIYNPYSNDQDDTPIETTSKDAHGRDLLISEDIKAKAPHADVDDIDPLHDLSVDGSSSLMQRDGSDLNDPNVWRQENAYNLLLNYGLVAPNNPSLVVPIDVETAYHRFILRSNYFKQRLSLEERLAQKAAEKLIATSARSLPPQVRPNLHKRYHNTSNTTDSGEKDENDDAVDPYNTLLSVLYHHTTKELPLLHLTSAENHRPQFLSVENALHKMLDDCLQSDTLRQHTLIYHILAIEPEIMIPILASRLLLELGLSLWSPKFSTAPFTFESLLQHLHKQSIGNDQSPLSRTNDTARTLGGSGSSSERYLQQQFSGSESSSRRQSPLDTILSPTVTIDPTMFEDVSAQEFATWVHSTLPTPSTLYSHLQKQVQLDDSKKLVKPLDHPRFMKYVHYTNVASVLADHRHEQIKLLMNQYSGYYDTLESNYGLKQTKM